MWLFTRCGIRKYFRLLSLVIYMQVRSWPNVMASGVLRSIPIIPSIAWLDTNGKIQQPTGQSQPEAKPPFCDRTFWTGGWFNIRPENGLKRLKAEVGNICSEIFDERHIERLLCESVPIESLNWYNLLAVYLFVLICNLRPATCWVLNFRWARHVALFSVRGNGSDSCYTRANTYTCGAIWAPERCLGSLRVITGMQSFLGL